MTSALPPSPFVFWGQDAFTIHLRIALRDVETQPDVSLTADCVSFKANGIGAHGDSIYQFKITTYKNICPEKSRMKVTGSCVTIEIPKADASPKDDPWPRLVRDNMKYPWIKVDFDRMEVSEDEDEKELEKKRLNDEYMKKLTKEISDVEQSAIADVKKNYLFCYNMFQFIGYAFVLVRVLMGLSNQEEQGYNGFADIGTVLMTCQIFSLLEVVHAWTGLVKTSYLTVLMQVIGRNFILFVVVWNEPNLQSSALFSWLSVFWCSAEIIRYPFYMLSSVDVELAWLTWLRYTMWVPLYPLGTLCEWLLTLSAVDLYAQSGRFSPSLPNQANFSFRFSWFLAIYLVLLPYFLFNMMRHMQRLMKMKLSRSAHPSSVKKAQ